MRPFGTILIAAYFPVTACFAILTRPEDEAEFDLGLAPYKIPRPLDLPELPFPIVRPIRH